MVKKRIIIGATALFALLMAACQGVPDTPCKPEQPKTAEISGEIEVVDENGVPVVSEVVAPLRNALVVETAKGKIEGLGVFPAGSTQRVKVTAKSGYTYKGMYFKYTSGYNIASYPKTPRTALPSTWRDIKVAGNITVVAIIEQPSGVDVNIE